MAGRGQLFRIDMETIEMLQRKLHFRVMALALFALSLAVGMLPPSAVSKDPPLAELTLKDVDGKRVRLSDYRGKVVVLNFWATWCIPCKEEIPLLVQADKDYRDRGVVFVGASLDDSKTKSRIPDSVKKYGIDYTIWYGASGGDLGKLGLGNAVPDTAFLDRDGRIVARVLGELRSEELKERLDWLTGDRTGPAPQALVKHLEHK
jgi:thiol-disulfide isomerase/thioredoxin